MKTIVWDVDDVLNNFMEEWFEKQWLKTHPECKVIFHDLVENPPHKRLGITLSDYRNSLDEFRKNYGSQFKPVPEVLDWFIKNGHNYRHIALTAVPIAFSNISASWVFTYFGRWIRSFNVVPSPRDTDPDFTYDISKKEYLQWLGKGDILVDDNLININDAASLGLEVIIFPKPWNGIVTSKIDVLKKLN